MQAKLDRMFGLSDHGTNVRTELLAGLTTFLTMAYIVFLQPAVLSGHLFGKPTGMDLGAVFTATCLSAALATAIMALAARYPVGLAPGMGENFFFVFSAIPAAAAAGYDRPWATALGAVFVAGVAFLLLTLLGLRERLMNAISPSLKHAIAAGIGLFIAFIGLRNAGLIQGDPGTLVTLNPHFTSPDILVFFFGLAVAAALQARGVRGAILWGILAALLFSAALHGALQAGLLPESYTQSPPVQKSVFLTRFHLPSGVVSAPPSMAPTFLQFELWEALSLRMLPFVVIFLFMDVFDTMGTLIGVAEAGGLMREGRLPRAGRAFLADAAGTVAGAAMGTSTVTAYIESAAGVQHGGRTGLTALSTAGCFLLVLFLSPLVATIGEYPPITAPALVLVGAMMMTNVKHIEWSDATEATPAFLVLLGIPLCHSIADGLSLGFIAYPVIKWAAGRGREMSPVMPALAVVLALYFVFVRGAV